MIDSLPRSVGLFLALLLAVGGRTPAQATSGPATPETAARVVVVPVHGQISTTTIRLLRRAVDAALDRSMSRIILEIDTPGGAVTVMRELESMLATLHDTGGIRTTAFVRHQAWSAGGYLALACDELLMAPTASIGAITPVELGAEGSRQIADDDVRSKMLSVMRADVRALLVRRGNVSEATLTLAEAMVDPRMEVVQVVVADENGLERTEIVDASRIDELASGGRRIVSQQRIGRGPLTLTSAEAQRFGFSSGTFDSVEHYLREELQLRPEQVLQLEESWSESAVAWLEAMKPLLFVLGFILLMIEVKVPGFGVPGALGIALIALGLFSSFLVGLADWTEILLFFLGLGLIAVEVFVMPGTIVFGFFGFLSVVFALVLSQQTFILPGDATQRDILTSNLLSLLYLILLVIAGSVLFYRFLPQIPFFRRALLAPPELPATGASTRFAGDPLGERRELLGVRGVAATPLRPAGLFERPDGTRLDVVSRGVFVERGVPLRVVDVSSNRIVVEPDESSLPPADPERGAASFGLLFLLVIAGFAMIVAEVFFPSLGLLSIGAALALVSAIFVAFTQHGETTGFVVLAIEAVGAPLALWLALRALPRTRLGRAFMLEAPTRDEVRAAAQERGLEELLGKRGITESVLRPSGFARIADQRIDVVSRGEPIEAGTPVRVILVDSNRVVVMADDEPSSGA